MKWIMFAVMVQTASALISDILYVRFDVLKWANHDDVIFWLFNIIVCFPLYFKGYWIVFQKKWLAVIWAAVSFALFGIVSGILMLFFHTEILNAPL